MQAAAASQIESMAEAGRGGHSRWLAQRKEIPELMPDLLRQLEQKDPLVRLTVARALGELKGDGRVWVVPDRLENDQDARVSEAAAAVLERAVTLRLNRTPLQDLRPGLRLRSPRRTRLSARTP